MAECFFDRERAVHKRLTDIGVGGFGSILVVDRLYPVLDRLYLRAEGEPDCADLVGRINEVCDCIGIVEGPPDLRVRMLAERCDQQRERIATLEAELGQLDARKPVANEHVNLALAVIDDELDDDVPAFALALSVLREAFA